MKKSDNSIDANAICLVCGTARENNETGYCINDHDDWLEPEDARERMDFAENRFAKSYKEIVAAINSNTSLIVVRHNPEPMSEILLRKRELEQFVEDHMPPSNRHIGRLRNQG